MTDAGNWFDVLNEQAKQRIVGRCLESFITLSQLFEWYAEPLQFVPQLTANGFGTPPFPVLAGSLSRCIKKLVDEYNSNL